MHKENKLPSLKAASLGIALLVLVGCNAVITKSEKNGKEEKDVKISTPLGELKVRKEVDVKELGLTLYPDAHLVPDEKGSGDTSANVNISTPFFGLRVAAAKYESSDAPEKIVDFYKKDMARYGKVISCKGLSRSGRAEVKDEGMTLKLDCDDIGGDSKSTTLKAGEGSSQHIVVVEPESKTTKIGLVYIRLRGGDTETM